MALALVTVHLCLIAPVSAHPPWLLSPLPPHIPPRVARCDHRTNGRDNARRRISTSACQVAPPGTNAVGAACGGLVALEWDLKMDFGPGGGRGRHRDHPLEGAP
jgi:hypothetical protein